MFSVFFEGRPLLSPPSRLNGVRASVSMGSRPRLSAAAAFAAPLEPPGWRRGLKQSCPVRSVGILGRAALSSLAQRSYVLSPPSRLNGVRASVSMGSRPRLSAAAAFAAPLEPLGWCRGIKRILSRPQCRDFWGEHHASLLSSLAQRSYVLSPPSRLNGVGASVSMGSRPRLSAAAAFAAPLEPRAGRRGIKRILSRPQCRDFGESGSLQFGAAELCAVAAFAAQWSGGIRFHGLTPTAKCCRRIRGSTRTPGLVPGDQKNPVPSAVSGFWGERLSPVWRSGAMCCRRLRGSMEWGHPFPWAYAHG